MMTPPRNGACPMSSDTQPALRVKWMEGERARDALAALYAQSAGVQALEGLWEPGDAQWWWSTCPASDWPPVAVALDQADTPVIVSLLVRGKQAWSCELAWLRSADRGSRKVVALMASAAVEQARAAERPLHFLVHERDEWLSRCLEGLGLSYDNGATVVQYATALHAAPAPPTLPYGYTVADDTMRDAGSAHPLARRNGAQIAARLASCAHYRRDFDLRVLDAAGEVAAYCVVWFDAVRGIAMFEPMRTEDGHQRRGLARALTQEGVRRAHGAGAAWMKVGAHASNAAACKLYENAGFTRVWRKLGFRYAPD